VNAGNCDPVALRSKATITAFAKELVKKIDMVAFGAPRIVMFGDGNKKGYTLVQLIETSNITGHFVEETNDIYLDIFSCKAFDPTVAEAVFRKYFKPTKMNTLFLKRQAPK
jgi:S-adenosylmethionine/arginine decarboxylase-like enzyme